VLAPCGKAVELRRTEPVEMVQPVRYRYAGDEAVSPTRADGSAVANLPRAPDEKPMEVKGPLGQVGTHLKSAHVKRQANRRR
jgi:hypothetical protein